MDRDNIKKPEFNKISDVIWEIPASYKKGMNVPARIYATKKLLDAMDYGVFEQTTNVACLPGIQKYALCMPDGHWGYGFPIGGVAAFDAKEGVISPGGIGFDINCVDGDSKVATEYGCFIKIKNFEKYMDESTKSINFETNQEISTQPILFMKKISNDIFKIKTKSGAEIIATGDHPFYTNNGMIELSKLNKNDLLAVNPFEGVEYQEASDEIIIDENNIRDLIGNRYKLIKELKNNNLLPLKFNSKKLPILAKLVGFLSGDGCLSYYYNARRKQNVWATVAIGLPEDLLEIKEDIQKLGFSSSNIKKLNCRSKVENVDGSTRIIEGSSYQMHISSQSVTVLLHLLGVPKGNKSRTDIKVPKWVKKAPLWIKRLYLAGLFGAELSKPTQDKKEKYGFKEPSISQNKILLFENNIQEFLLDIEKLLMEFGITCNKIYRLKGVINKFGEETVKLSLKISSEHNNLIKLFGKIGLEYCKKKKDLAMLALQYLRIKLETLRKINKAVLASLKLKNNGISRSSVFKYAEDQGISKALIASRLNSGKTNNYRIPRSFLAFNEFIVRYAIDGASFVWDEIDVIENLDEERVVYDFTIDHKDHNFLANNFVISNCGMRLVTTNLTIKEVQPKLKELIDTLFKIVPAGVGSKGFLKVNENQFKEIMESGVKWCVENGYGWEEDLERTEGHGLIPQADSTKVSDRAVKRGINQLGTLGSGNHYLEVQVAHANEIFDEEKAKAFGIHTPDQIVIMVHCGSRGFGHQIGTDYLKTFEPAMKKYGITVNDRELACAPFSSKEGQDYFKAMACAANMAFTNRQVILHRIREGFSQVFKKSPEALELNLVYDVAHNIAKVEKYKIDNKMKEVVVHRKGSTRAFGPDNNDLDKLYRKAGQPVIIGGSMETGSYLLVGTKKAEEETFGTTAHGSGRTMSRSQAKREVRGDKLQRDMEKRGIYVRAVSMSGLAEEAGVAYKPINDVVDTLDIAGISKRVVGLKPLGNIKG